MAFSRDSTIHIEASSPTQSLRILQSPKGVIAITVPDANEPPPSPGNDYVSRSQWLRAAVLGATDGLISIASLIIGVGAINQTPLAMLISGLAGLIGGACSMAIGEYVSVYAQYDIEVASMKSKPGDDKERELPSPWKAALASALSFMMGGIIPLLAGGFVRNWMVRAVVTAVATSAGLAAFGATGAILGGSPPGRTTARVLVGGWLAMLVTYGILTLFGLAFKIEVSDF